LRLVRCLAGRLLDTDAQIDVKWVVERIGNLFVAWGAAPAKAVPQAMKLIAIALHGENEYGSALSLVRDAHRAAAFVRERLSTDTWRLIDGLRTGLDRNQQAPLSEAEAFERAHSALQSIAAISGLAQENINRGAGWRLLEIGRRVERAINTCRVARHFGHAEAPAEDLDVLLDLIDSPITYRSRYMMGVALSPVRDMVLLDPFNPRSVAFQVERLEEHVSCLPVLSDDGMLETPQRQVVKLAADISTAVAGALDNNTILTFEQNLLNLADAIAARYFLQGPNAARADKSGGLA
jgi:uncharacterized alpha-E superfamily protein